ncbi:glycosyltransferase family 4 protein [Amphiplicatus metriothermophilus]|uniref:Glycosyltransferase involved in cell wall bisynthesis n=1 Tax=Amphiplicatus metriothermophilus TaxID=1519374 RepID=A0A239PQ07_9PROT|nr:glycosyltransferase family 4 protein [Amphiplicatus metriothermophilus]MBB5518622.1 glycosyltransferase involved in cell wall biosynthesis [Amphiplicatus metriothermophilus]SNT72220.1 Glycosyltransferase involved in cell wall bisynthesis [Amphiplicatus metriothermophilus]
MNHAASQDKPSARRATATGIRNIVLVGSYPPRRCGIATFTADIRAALEKAAPEARIGVVAMIDPGGRYDFSPEVIETVSQMDRRSYRAAAERVNELHPDVVCIQHEYGLFGGPAGEYLLDFVEALDAPVVVTLHTVLANPDEDQRRALERLAARASRLIVMARRGEQILRRVYDIPPARIAYAPHGAPDLPLSDAAPYKAELGLEGRDVLLTFGLLSPNKGLEYMIRAMPRILEARPRAFYVVLGATHPHLIAREGEAYRNELKALADSLGVGENVVFVNRYADADTLLSYLRAADVYVTPYLNEAQITSGTLSYAVALGKPVISTPYWHAAELLAEGRGVLAPFRDERALADAAVRLLCDETLREGMRAKAYAAGRSMIWPRIAERYLEIFRDAAMDSNGDGKVVSLRQARRDRLASTPSLEGLARFTDDCGLLQHGLFGVPDRNHGYCVDDNARALMLTCPLAGEEGGDPTAARLAWIYAAFVNHAWNEERGAFRNFMSYDRRWLEEAGSEDSVGRSFQAVAVAAAQARDPQLRRWARDLAARAMPHMERLRSPRAQAFVLLGLCALLRAKPFHPDARRLAADLAGRLKRGFDAYAGPEWRWFENVLAYDNARLPQALIVAGETLGRRAWIETGADALAWLCRKQTGRGGAFRPVGTDSFGAHRTAPKPFDQQPLEAAATIDACAAAYAASGEERWLEEARRAYDWYFGGNDLGLVLAQPEDGLCFDGLTPYNANFNQGAESALSYLQAVQSMKRLEKAAARAAETAQLAG